MYVFPTTTRKNDGTAWWLWISGEDCIINVHIPTCTVLTAEFNVFFSTTVSVAAGFEMERAHKRAHVRAIV